MYAERSTIRKVSIAADIAVNGIKNILNKMARKLPETINEEELKLILKLCNKIDHKLAFLLGFYEAMRISEIVNLKMENINEGQQLIMIKEAKGKKDRNIPINPVIRPLLKHIPVKSGIRALEIAFKQKALKALNRSLHFHSLRHSGATYYMKNGWNIRELQQFLGHSRLDTTAIYTHVSPEDLVKKMYSVYKHS